MQKDPISFENVITSRVFFFGSVFIFIYWILGQVINVYHFALVGAIYEILWLFMLLGLLGLPIISMIFWWKERFNLKSFYLYTIIMCVFTILVMMFS